MVTRNTSWRGLGKVPYETWRDVILGAGGLPEYAAYEVWLALGDDSALALQQLREESSFASDFEAIPADWWNAWNLQIDGVGIKNRNAVEAAKAWRSRVYDPSYKNGVYANTDTIEEFFNAYAPEWDNNDTEAYIRESVDGINTFGLLGGSPVATADSIKPKFTSAPVTKQRDGQGFNYGTRSPIVGLVIHETQGRGTGPGYQAFFSCPGGERCNDALVDWLIDRDGVLWEYQDPYDTNRIPWASGGAENNGAIGKPINAKYRGSFGGVNKVYAAVEMVKTDTEALTKAQITTAGKLLAFVAAKAGYPANDWQYPDALGGNVYTAPHHSDISQTSCRISDSDKNAIIAVAQKSIDAFYAGVTPGDPGPEVPVDEIVPGVDLAIAKRFFGIAKGEDNLSYSYDPNGPVSKMWTERAKETGVWPKLLNVWLYGAGANLREYFVFEGGYAILASGGSVKELEQP